MENRIGHMLNKITSIVSVASGIQSFWPTFVFKPIGFLLQNSRHDIDVSGVVIF